MHFTNSRLKDTKGKYERGRKNKEEKESFELS